MHLDECVGVGREGPSRLLIGESGCFIWVDPRDFAGASAVVDAIDRAAPAEVVFELEGAVL